MSLNPKLGPQLLDIITAGMYDNPLMVFREYVQNSVDAIDELETVHGIKHVLQRINITIDGKSRTITVEDSGIGVNRGGILDVTQNIGISSKIKGRERGFRGIGRLGGLAYCKKLIFETKSVEDKIVSVIEWDAEQLRHILRLNNRGHSQKSIKDIIKEVVQLGSRHPNREDGEHFFRVKLVDIVKFHKDELININTVYDYLSNIAPVPFNHEIFRFAKEIDNKLNGISNHRSYCIYLNGKIIYRPHADRIVINGKHIDDIVGVKLFEFNATNGEVMAVGWHAETAYRASFPKDSPMRGIRVKECNIEVGNEYFLADSFTERRFSTWHVGEIHLLPGVLSTNARRDGFEVDEEYERFLEQAKLLGRHLSGLVRNASKARTRINAYNNLMNLLLNSSEQLVFVDVEHRNETQRAIQCKLKYLEGLKCQSGNDEGMINELRSMVEANYNGKSKLMRNVIDGRSLRFIDKKAIVENLCKSIFKNFESCNTPNELINKIIAPYIK